MAIVTTRRLERLPQQFFSRLVQTTAALQAAGHDVINLGQGNPDQPTPPHIIRRLQEAVLDPLTHRYPPFNGLRTLRQAVSAWYDKRFGVTLDPDSEVCIMIGSKVGLQEISLCLLEAGDVCLMPDPGYPDYWSGVALVGGVSYPLPLTANNGFVPDLGALPPDVVQRAKLMFLNFPGNPTGAVAPPEFFKGAVAFAEKNGVVVAHDSPYGDLVFDGRESRSFLQTPGAIEVGVEFGTLSKSYNMAGWRVGWAVGNREVIAALNLIQDHLHCSQFAAVQLAAAEALAGPQESVWQLRDLYQQRRDTWVEGCRRIGWPVTPSAGSFFVWCPVAPGLTSQAFADRLLQEAHVVVAPGNGFGTHGEGYVRVSLTTDVTRLQEAAGRIGKLNLF